MGDRKKPPVSHSVSGCFEDDLVVGASRAVEALAEAVPALVENVPRCLRDDEVTQRGLFRPDEEEELLVWFAHFLTIRNGLWEILGEVSKPVGGEISRVLNTFGWRCFVLGYSAACLIVRLDQYLVEEAATNKLVQRKLNEGSRRYRIPRKQFTAVFESFTDPQKAKLMDQAMRFAHRHRSMLEAMGQDSIVGEHVRALGEREAVLDPSRRRYAARLLSYLAHSLRRRGASARQQTLFSALEASGRLVSEFHDHWTLPRIGRALQAELDALLMPGDVLITRHDHAVTNLFLPGYWPHAALYVGSCEDRGRLGIEINAKRCDRWSGDRRVLEALKDGVLYRPLEQTLAVDVVAVIRPQLEVADITTALARVSVHEGKGYNFDFDFFRSDRLVCTEVVYRAFDGLGGIEIPLKERSGRPTLAAEDLLDLALAGRGFEAIAICGAAGCPDRVATGAEAHHLIAESYSAETRTISST
ncbi:MAG: YiiX/YebB-like N1pC/P60 family cysteine hydrolase [Acidobacteriota bacterium]